MNVAFLETIRHILMYEWDPIGVCGIRGAEDEYDGYIPSIYQLLEAGHCSPEIAACLEDIEVHAMACQARPEVCNAVAIHIILEWKKASTA